MEAEIEKLRKRADTLEKLRIEFPDLREYRTRWRSVIVSKMVNSNPQAVYMNHTCGCCPDAILQAWFYVEREGERVYTDPPTVNIGEMIPYRDEDEPENKWWEGWADNVRKAIGKKAVALLHSRCVG